MKYALSIQAENMPRNVGPFDTRGEAQMWATQNIRTGSWGVIPLTPPLTVLRQGRN